MQLSRDEISKNYFKTLKLATGLIHKIRHEKGYSANLSPALVTELAQSAAGSETAVRLIQTEKFNTETYRPVMIQVIDQCKRELFPDVKKKRFISLSQTDMEISSEDRLEIYDQPEAMQLENSSSLILHKLKSILDITDFKYINQLLQLKSVNLSLLVRIFGMYSKTDAKTDFDKISQKVKLFRKLYPEGRIFDSCLIADVHEITESDLISCYKNVYLGIENSFPLLLLQQDACRKAAVLTRYLVEKILETEPFEMLEKEDETFFIRHKLQNVYRLFNYSANRALANAYPQLIHPWLFSRTPENYWENKTNRIHAVRWLVEEKLQMVPENLYACNIRRKDFAENGLSYMFNRYFNSVSRALQASYPQLNPWEAGPVPFNYWDDKNAGKAVRWLIRKNNWQITELPDLVAGKKFNRKTFSRFGLATLFERKFNKNIYQAVNSAFPGQFEPWEFGKVSREFWTDHDNMQRVTRWMAQREGLNDNEIPHAIRNRRLTKHCLKKYSFGSALQKISEGRLENLFGYYFRKEHIRNMEEHRIMSRLHSLIRKEKQRKHFGYYILYGFFIPNMQVVSDIYIEKYERILKRRKRYSEYC